MLRWPPSRERMGAETFIGRYWAKTGAAGEEPAYHPLVYHGLDVAAAGEALLAARPELLAAMVAVSRVAEAELRGWLTFLLAIHDLGKIADSFQALAPELMQHLQGRRARLPYDVRHDRLGFALWKSGLAKQLGPALGCAAEKGPGKAQHRRLEIWLQAAMGHHGRPVEGVGAQLQYRLAEDFTAVEADAVAIWRQLAALLLPAGVPAAVLAEDADEDAACGASWLVAGFANLADWIGSNRLWFPFQPPARSFAEYWHEVARKAAPRAVAEAGVGSQPVRAARGLRGLWPEAANWRLSELQALAETIPLADGPQLFVLEEVTGGGKTEAALTLAHRLMAQGLGDGLFFALPTMATANAMHERLAGMFRQLYSPAATPSLVLAHGRSHLQLAGRLAATTTDAAYQRGEPTASQDCAAWLADSRKKALLAQVGVGTIDQGLLGVLPVRHQGLRLVGLVGKVLVVDEVHSCDAYVLSLLESLLRFHARFGGSAILLSATLSQRARAGLARAFAEGLGRSAPVLGKSAYPLLTRVSAAGTSELAFAARAELCREVELTLLTTEVEVEEHLATALAGGCACWVRNTVDDAIAAAEHWRARLGPERVHLLHARFTVADRRRLESEVLSRFGKTSTAEGRRGHLLIATQVVEQSLDLDFDALVSDLAPADRLIQRAGRLKRHRRDAAGNPIPSPDQRGPDQRGPAVLAVFGPWPDPEPADGWFKAAFEKAAWVYPHHGQLWLTARWLTEHGRCRMPEDARDWIEAVFGPEADDATPAALLPRSEDAATKDRVSRGLAIQYALKLDFGYRKGATEWLDDLHTPTRLGEPTVTLRLARRTANGLEPWHADLEEPWEQSEIRVRQARIAAEGPGADAEEIERVKATMRDQGRGVVLLELHEAPDGTARGQALDTDGREVEVRYSAEMGLSLG